MPHADRFGREIDMTRVTYRECNRAHGARPDLEVRAERDEQVDRSPDVCYVGEGARETTRWAEGHILRSNAPKDGCAR